MCICVLLKCNSTKLVLIIYFKRFTVFKTQLAPLLNKLIRKQHNMWFAVLISDLCHHTIPYSILYNL